MKTNNSNVFASSWKKLITGGIGGAFYRISAQSKGMAEMNRGLKYTLPNHSLDTVTAAKKSDFKGKDYLANQVLMNPKALTQYKEQISEFIFEELSEGKFTFSKRLAKNKDMHIKTLEQMKGLQNSPLPHTPAMVEEWNRLCDVIQPDLWDKKESLLVKHWVKSVSNKLPPFCVWTDSAIDSWISETLGKKVERNGSQQIKDKRLKLGLLQMPFEVVTSRSEGIEGLEICNEIKFNKARFKSIAPKVTIDHLRGGALDLERGALRLQILKNLVGFSDEVVVWMNKICGSPKIKKEFEDSLGKAVEDRNGGVESEDH